jgi:hypothetical protein
MRIGTEEPYERIVHVRVCEGGGMKVPLLLGIVEDEAIIAMELESQLQSF